jgi:hypothetical protein
MKQFMVPPTPSRLAAPSRVSPIAATLKAVSPPTFLAMEHEFIRDSQNHHHHL